MNRQPILLVEDDIDHAELIRLQLEDARVDREMLHAESLGDALVLAAERDPYVVVLDLGLPDSEGLGAVEAFAAACPHLAIVVLTSNTSSEVGTESIRVGAQDYLVKSEFNPDMLIRSMHYAVERKRIHLELEQRNRDIEAFASVASHDLRSPLRRMGQLADGLRDLLAPAEEPVAEILRFLGRDMRRLEALVEDMLRFARAGKAGLERSRFPLADAVRTAMEHLAVDLEESGAEVSVGDLPTVEADQGLLTTVLQNLIGNAVKYVREGTPAVSITGAEVDGEWRIEVEDGGIGVEESQRMRIFDPCVRAVLFQDFEGSGLGLATCRNIIEAHGGRIGVDSDGNRGSTFWFTLPGVGAGVATAQGGPDPTIGASLQR